MSTGPALVPCPCKFCCGRKVSSYVRRQHSQHQYHGLLTVNQHVDGLSSSEVLPQDFFTRQEQKLVDLQDIDVVTDNLDSACQASENNCSSGTNSGSAAHSEPEAETDSEPEAKTDSEPEEAESEPLESEPELELETSQRVDKTHPDVSNDLLVYDTEIARRPLYERATVTIIQALVSILCWFTAHPSISKDALSSMLHLQHHSILPPHNLLPDSYENAMKIIDPFLIKPIVFHACRNDCIIFRGDNTDLLQCPQCKANRYSRGCIPAKRFSYLPIGPRLIRIFGTPNLAQIVQCHSQRLSQSAMYDVQDSQFWKNIYSKNGLFLGDPKGISLALCTDGVNPFKHNKVAYSMWPIVFTILNLPRIMRHEFGNLLLVGIVPGNSRGREPSSLHPYLEIAVDELLTLTGQSVYDTYSKAPFHLKVKLLLYVLDYPGVGKVFSIMGSGAYQGCAWCDVEGSRSVILDKMIYLQNRRYLPAASELRKDACNFPERIIEVRPPPSKRQYHQMIISHHAYDNTKNKSQADSVSGATGCKGTYPMMKLPYHDRVNQCFPDAMHTIKDAVEHVFNLITGKEDSLKVRAAESSVGRFNLNEEMNSDSRKRKRLGSACFLLSTQDIKVADSRACAVISPSADFVPGAIFTRSFGLKSHDWKELICKGVLKFCLRGMLGKQQRTTLFMFLDALQEVLAESQKPDRLPELDRNLNLALALMERDFPMSVQVITMHLLHHIVEGISKYGPVYGTWMFPFERFNSWMTRRAMNRQHPEATILETYRIFEWCNFMKLSGYLPEDCSDVIDSDNPLELSDHDLQLLDEAYQSIMPTYSRLSEEYKRQLNNSIRRRIKSQFPCRAKWQPPFLIGETEQDMLRGPQRNVCIKKKVVIEHPVTHRKVTFAAAKLEISARHQCCYVQLDNSPHTTTHPVVGQIQKCFNHTFCGHNFQMVHLKIYKNLQLDKDSKLWWVNSKDTKEVIVTIEHLTYTLVVAYEDEKLWFLNCK